KRQRVGETPGVVARSDYEARRKYSRRHRPERTYTWIIEQILVARNVGAQLLLQSGQRSRALGGRLEIVCPVEEHCPSYQRAQVRSARGEGADRQVAARRIAADCDPSAIAVPAARVVGRPLNGEHRVFQCCRKWMLGRQSIIEDDRQIARFGKLHPQLAKRGWAAESPSTTVQVDNHRMSTGALGHRYVSAKARAQLDVLFETANCRKILVVNCRQLLPSAALRNNIAGGTPHRQLTQNLPVVFADHTLYLPPLRKGASTTRHSQQSTRGGPRASLPQTVRGFAAEPAPAHNAWATQDGNRYFA